VQSLGENKSGYRAENSFFSMEENLNKSPHLFTLTFMPT